MVIAKLLLWIAVPMGKPRTAYKPPDMTRYDLVVAVSDSDPLSIVASQLSIGVYYTYLRCYALDQSCKVQ